MVSEKGEVKGKRVLKKLVGFTLEMRCGTRKEKDKDKRSTVL
jgi:hypothetical protein